MHKKGKGPCVSTRRIPFRWCWVFSCLLLFKTMSQPREGPALPRNSPLAVLRKDVLNNLEPQNVNVFCLRKTRAGWSALLCVSILQIRKQRSRNAQSQVRVPEMFQSQPPSDQSRICPTEVHLSLEHLMNGLLGTTGEWHSLDFTLHNPEQAPSWAC